MLAKAMVISIDKATAVRMYDKVQKHWKAEMARLRKNWLSPIRRTSRNSKASEFFKDGHGGRRLPVSE